MWWRAGLVAGTGRSGMRSVVTAGGDVRSAVAAAPATSNILANNMGASFASG